MPADLERRLPTHSTPPLGSCLARDAITVKQRRIQPVRIMTLATLFFSAFLLVCWPVSAQRASAVRTNGFIVESDRGTVQIRAYPNDAWLTLRGPRQSLNLRDSVRTELRSGVTILNPQTVGIGLDESSRITVAGDRLLRLETGNAFLKTLGEVREEDGLVVLLPGGKALARGTEWVIRIDPESGKSTLSVFSGTVTLVNTNLPGDPAQTVEALDVAVMSSNTPPTLTTAKLTSAGLGHVIQWMLYYPGVIYLGDLGAAVTDEPALRLSVEAYQRGNLLAALTNYPSGRQPSSRLEAIYHAALLLAAGQVTASEDLLRWPGVSSGDSSVEERLTRALQEVVATVTGAPFTESAEPQLASEFLAKSYYLQYSPQARNERNRLGNALAAAQAATKLAPEFGFAWAQVAELEFGFGRRGEAEAAIDQALKYAPENAQAWTVKGFLLAGLNQLTPASKAFEEAISLDPNLGNAWLGRGLLRIRQRDIAGGLQDLQVAVTQEPNRAVLRSYLAKAYAVAGNPERALSELATAMKWDPKDPTPPFYAALINSQENRINAAVRDLEASQALNDNRSVYRSGLLLDQDQAVRGANLAAIYRDAGMLDVGVREASRAVSYDYANASAHLFLANSYDALRDPRGITLRYETPWQNELLLANLLAPAAAGAFSQNVSQQDYSRLFERDHAGVFSQTAYLGNGDWLESFSQYGIFGDSSYAVDVNYLNLEGWRPNEEEQNLSVTAKFKQQITPKDNLFFEMIYSQVDSGDLIQYYDPADAHPNLHYQETQLPIALIGYHREWNPQSHTLFLAVRAEDTLTANDTGWSTLTINTNDVPPSLGALADQLSYDSQFVLYSLEAQQIWATEDGRFTSIFGGRYQWGGFDTTSSLADPRANNAPPYWDGQVDPDLQRGTFYFYQTAEPVRTLQLTVGLAYDNLTYPVNHRTPPLFDQESNLAEWCPKAGFIWTPMPSTHLRGGYAKSVGGVSFDQSFRLEPNQVAGFVQAFRSLVPESIAGSVVAPVFDTYGASFDHRFPTGTYIGLTGAWLESDSGQGLGAFNTYEQTFTDDDGNTVTITTFEPPLTLHTDLHFTERNFIATLNQLLYEHWSFGATYRLSDAQLQQQFVEAPFLYEPSALLQSLDLSVLFNHQSGFFAGFDGLWFHQNNDDPSNPTQTGDDFWQFNLIAGWRFLQRRIEVTAGVLNLTAQDYHLSPLNLIPYLPRDRVYTASLKLNF
ncbi:MAG TPA: tetratricopeptide repeat protein [Verrucomicrobiota bacterium]|nr:tetratricopeptide repeat protein [Verrucomicrobiota bacterium]